MAIIKCKMCGGDLNLVEGVSTAECEYCGSIQTIPKVDDEKKLTLFARANRLRASCEFDKAAGIYESIVADFPEEAEAYWGLVLCKYGIEYVDDPATGKKIPTCHRSSYDSILDDDNYEQAVENADVLAQRIYRDEAKLFERIRKGILEVSSNERPYDIFICYKETDEKGDRTDDSVIAQDLYMALTDKGYRVFFSRITLQSKLGEAYEPYIFAALNSAKVMLAVGTRYEYYNAVWVKNEWSRYLKICAADKSKHLIPCYKNLDPEDMPREFNHLQGADLGKMGAIQDILFNMEKYIPLKKNTTVIQERVVVGGTVGNKIASLLDRGNMALEDGDWAKADSFFEDVLNNDSKNAQAYLGKTLAQERCRTFDAFVRKRKDATQSVRSETQTLKPDTAHIEAMVEKYTLPGFVDNGDIRSLYDYDYSYPSEVAGRKQQYRNEEIYWTNHKSLSRAEKFAEGSVAEYIQQEKNALFAVLSERIKKAEAAEAAAIADAKKRYAAHLRHADEQAEALYQEGLTERENWYQDLLQTAKTSSDPEELTETAESFEDLGDYQDSKNLAVHCRKRAAEEQAKLDAEAERRRKAAEEAEQQRILKEKRQKARKKLLIAITAAVLAVAMVAAAVFVIVVLPAQRYAQAEQLLQSGEMAKAALTFAKLGGYQDARERAWACWEAVAVRDTISTWDEHTVAVKADGTVVATKYTGAFDYGQCDVSGWSDIVAISAGGYHTVGLKADGTLVATGSGFAGQCDVSRWHNIVAISAGDAHTVGLKADGTVVAVGYEHDSRCQVSGWSDIIAIGAGRDHTVGLKADGTVVAVGDNKYGQCDVSGWSDIVAISAGGYHTVGLKADGTVVAVGWNDDGQCDVSGWTDITTINAGAFHTVALQADGKVVATKYTGAFDYGQCDVSGWTDVVAVSAGSNNTVALKADGTVVAKGYNEYGQCNTTGEKWKDIKLPNS